MDESGETRAIRRSTHPATVRTLREGLQTLYIPAGAVVLVHASLTELGWVAGGAHTVVSALVDVFAAQGTRSPL